MPVLKDSDVESCCYHILLFLFILVVIFFLTSNGMGGIDI